MGKPKSDPQARAWQITLNNPVDKGFTHEKIKQIIGDIPTVSYWCMADEEGNTFHTHIYLVTGSPKRFSTIANLFDGKAHIEKARAGGQANRDYIRKEGKFADTDKAETRIPDSFEEWGTLPRSYGKSIDRETEIFDQIQADIESGKTPGEIMARGASFVKHERIIKKMFYLKRKVETPPIRDITVYYHVGKSGSGKSYTYINLCNDESIGEGNVYFMSDLLVGGLDNYGGERILFIDELRPCIPYRLLLQLLDRYRMDIHCRFANCLALWQEIHITSVIPPSELYKEMRTENEKDSYQQLQRRISFIVYHWIDEAGNFRQYQMPMSDYTTYEALKQKA